MNMLKIRDFSSKGNGDAQRDYDEDDNIISYEPPSQGTRSRLRSPPQYEDVPRFKDEKPFIVSRDGDGNIQVCYDNIIDGYDNDNFKMHRMEQMGLPTGFSMDMNPQKQKKGAKKTLYCNISLVELNSKDTRRSHQQGVKHLKKMQIKRVENEERYC